MTPLDDVLGNARAAVRRAAQVCLGVLAEAPATPDAMAKLGKEPVTIADYGSQAVVLEAVARMYPDHAVVSEEGAQHLRENSGDVGAEQLARLVSAAIGRPAHLDEIAGWIDHGGAGGDYTWVIDPIDGTKGFLRRDQFAIAVGLLRDGVVVGGVLGCPHFDGGTLYWAGEGLGAWAEDMHGRGSRPVRVSETGAAGARMLGSVESAHGDPALVTAVVERAGLGGGMVRIDSQVKYGAVADGKAEVYLRPRNRPDYRERIWDHAAGVAVVTEAGGRVTDLDGKDLDFTIGASLEDNRGVVATNGVIHDSVLEALGAVEAVG